MVMGGRVNEANDLATLKAAIANVSLAIETPVSYKILTSAETNEFR